MLEYEINNKKYYEYNEINEENPQLLKSCRTRAIYVEKHKIPKDETSFGRKVNDKWVKSDGTSHKWDKFFIRKEYVDDNLVTGNVIVYEPLPEIIKLTKKELFRGPNGEALKIKVVGKREANGIYFSLYDVSVAFEMDGLCKAVKRKEKGGYREEIHYKCFYIVKGGICSKCRIRYLTFEGLLRVLINTKSEKAKPYIEWVKKTLFTVQMGTPKQKQKLAKKLNGVPVEELRRTLKTSAIPVSCVYLFDIVSAKEAPPEMNLKTEDGYVCKYGYTSDLATRSMQHKNKYGNIPNAEVVLRLHACVDNEYTSQAEAKIRKKLNKMEAKVTYEDNAELVHLTDKQVKEIKNLFLKISQKYCIVTKNVAQQMTVIEAKYKVMLAEKDTEMAIKDKEMADMKTELMEAKKDTELMEARKDNEIMGKDNEIMRKDMEILKLRLEIAEKH
jgi:hypothetical protein